MTVCHLFIYPVKHLEKRTEFSSSSTSTKGFEARANGARANRARANRARANRARANGAGAKA
jgi:hypothetical protein